MINITELTEYERDTYEGMTVHDLYCWPSYLSEKTTPGYGGKRAACGTPAASLYTTDPAKITCQRCKR